MPSRSESSFSPGRCGTCCWREERTRRSVIGPRTPLDTPGADQADVEIEPDFGPFAIRGERPASRLAGECEAGPVAERQPAHQHLGSHLGEVHRRDRSVQARRDHIRLRLVQHERHERGESATGRASCRRSCPGGLPGPPSTPRCAARRSTRPRSILPRIDTGRTQLAGAPRARAPSGVARRLSSATASVKRDCTSASVLRPFWAARRRSFSRTSSGRLRIVRVVMAGG